MTVDMNNNFDNTVNDVHGVVYNKHKEEKRDMEAMKVIYKELVNNLITLKESNPSKEEALEAHKNIFLKSAGVNSEDELNQGQKMGLKGHMGSVMDQDAQTLIELDIKILQKYIG